MGVVYEVSLIRPDYIYWFITLDETYHKLSLEGNKGGMTELRWINPSFSLSREMVVVIQNHVTGMYAYNLSGEVFATSIKF